jgi:hypothetical protein
VNLIRKEGMARKLKRELALARKRAKQKPAPESDTRDTGTTAPNPKSG